MHFFTREFFSKVPRELFNFPAITSILYLSPVLQVFCKWKKEWSWSVGLESPVISHRDPSAAWNRHTAVQVCMWITQ